MPTLRFQFQWGRFRKRNCRKLQKEYDKMALKLSDLLAKEKIEQQDAALARQRIDQLTLLNGQQKTQIATLMANQQAAIDAGFDPALLQQISDTQDATEAALNGTPVLPPQGFGQGDTTTTPTPTPPDTATPPATTTPPDTAPPAA